MKINVEKIRPRSDDKSPRMNVSVLISDEGELPLRNASVDVYVDKSITNLEEIKEEAIKQALKFLSEIVAEKS